MEELFTKLIGSLTEKSGEEILEAISTVSLQNIYKLEHFFAHQIHIDYNSIYIGVASVSLGLLLLLYLKKGFEIYILGIEGDADVDPIVHLINVVRVIAVIVGFNTIFDLSIEIMGKLMSVLFTKNDGKFNALDIAFALKLSTILFSILYIIVVILIIKIIIQLIKRSIELFILRIGVPIAALGFLNSDKGIWSIYVRKFAQEMITVVLQIFLFILGTEIFATQKEIFPMLIGISILSASLKLPQFLSEIIVMPSQGNAFGKIHSSLMIFNSVKSLIAKH